MSKSSSSSIVEASAQPSDNKLLKMKGHEGPPPPFTILFDDFLDGAPLHGLNAKMARELTQSSLTQVWNGMERVRQQPYSHAGQVIVYRRDGQGALLGAKDFYIPEPYLREIHCLPLTQDSANILTERRQEVSSVINCR
ncbi:unnamed protein product [Haemonchus placei]|uniref:Uncharacterized protein n=1 Tax=Haemonchus placei TaxID=6290 RepID=A0A0N4W3C2_HAEPC|nr:unnamed protein product [Haemonchus placei]